MADSKRTRMGLDKHGDTFDRLYGNGPTHFCLCSIGAGGKPCISREFCDAFGEYGKDWYKEKHND